MGWLILINFIASMFSIGIIWRGFCETDSSDLMLGIILLIVNFGCLVFNLVIKIAGWYLNRHTSKQTIEDVKTKFQWTLEYHSEILNKIFPFTIYDYKEDWEQHVGCATGVNDYLYTTKIDWHIGGKSADDTILVKVWLKNKLNEINHN